MKKLFWKSLVALTIIAVPAQATVVTEVTCRSDGVNGVGVTWADMPGTETNSSWDTELFMAREAVGICTNTATEEVDFDFLGKIDDPSESSENDHQLAETINGTNSLFITADYDFVEAGGEKYVELLSLDMPANTDWTLVGVLFKGGNQDNHLYYDLDGLSLSILNDTLEKLVGKNGSKIQSAAVSHISLFGVQGIAAVPIPASLSLALTGLLGLVVLGRRRRSL